MRKPETALSRKRAYVQPQITVVEIEQADIICQSGGTEEYGGGDTSGWFNS